MPAAPVASHASERNSPASLRREYALTSLRRSDLASNPLIQFRAWFDQAVGTRFSGRLRKFLIRFYKAAVLGSASPSTDVNAAVLATADAEGKPSARVVLLKGLEKGGFVFFTSYESRKGRDLAINPHAALVFYWPAQERQVNIAGEVQRISSSESEAYFQTRPRGSQLAAWASQQSEAIDDRLVLELQLEKIEAQFRDDTIPKPPSWGGYILIPDRMEFWQGRPGRLHDRFCYTRQPTGVWSISRLCP